MLNENYLKTKNKPYQVPKKPHITVNPDQQTVKQEVESILKSYLPYPAEKKRPRKTSKSKIKSKN